MIFQKRIGGRCTGLASSDATGMKSASVSTNFFFSFYAPLAARLISFPRRGKHHRGVRNHIPRFFRYFPSRPFVFPPHLADTLRPPPPTNSIFVNEHIYRTFKFDELSSAELSPLNETVTQPRPSSSRFFHCTPSCNPQKRWLIDALMENAG